MRNITFFTLDNILIIFKWTIKLHFNYWPTLSYVKLEKNIIMNQYIYIWFYMNNNINALNFHTIFITNSNFFRLSCGCFSYLSTTYIFYLFELEDVKMRKKIILTILFKNMCLFLSLIPPIFFYLTILLTKIIHWFWISFSHIFLLFLFVRINVFSLYFLQYWHYIFL